MAKLDDLPPEILRIIAKLIYLDHLPRSLFRCIDPHGLPSTYPDGRLISSTQSLTKSTLHALCLTSVDFYHAARPLLWRRLQITLPYSFLLLLRSLGASRLAEAYEQLGGPQGKRLQTDGSDDEMLLDKDTKAADVDDRMSFNAMLAAVGLARVTGGTIYSNRRLSHPDAEQGMQLVWTEDRTYGQTGTPSRYQVTLSHDDEADLSEVHRYPRVLDFSTFTTQGMRRTVGEGEDQRFVTPAKLLALITSVSYGLMAFGASPTMDSALTVEVLEALLFRQGEHLAIAESSAGISPHRSLRGVSVGRSRDRSGKERRRLESLDFCNCTSKHFEMALTRFVDKYLRKFSGRTTSTVVEEEGGSSEGDEAEEQRGRDRSRGRPSGPGSRPVTLSRSISTNRHAPSIHPARATQFPSLERLCLHGVHFASELLTPFVLAFPRLTHLDLTGTRIDDALLQALSSSGDLELESLSLARCTRITSECITELLVDSTACASLTELSLEGTLLFPTPITSDDLLQVITMAPCLRSGRMRYLDLSGCGVTNAHLEKFHNQTSLIDLGLNASPNLALESLASFLIARAPNVQVLDVVDSFFSLRALPSTTTILKLYSSLLQPCASVPPLSLAEQVAEVQAQMQRDTFASNEGTPTAAESRVKSPVAPTNLRVVGLDMSTLRQIGEGISTWRAILGKGRRGWLVDVSSGPDPEAVDEDLDPDAEQDQGQGSSIFPQLDRNLHVEAVGRRGADASRSRSRVDDRGRSDPRRGVGSSSGAWEPETPPRRTSKSPSLRTSLSRSRSNAARVASSSRSRARLATIGAAQQQLHSPLSSTAAVPPAASEATQPADRRGHVIRGLAKDHPRRIVLEQLAAAKGHVVGTTGWHSKKMEVLLGLGMLGREAGSYAYAAYQA